MIETKCLLPGFAVPDSMKLQAGLEVYYNITIDFADQNCWKNTQYSSNSQGINLDKPFVILYIVENSGV